MIVKHKIKMDFTYRGVTPRINAVQGDSNTRMLEISLYERGADWPVPEEASVLLRFCKPDGTGGMYDTLPDGTQAWSIDGNVVCFTLAPQVLAVPGLVQAQLEIVEGDASLGSSAFHIFVEPDPSNGAAASEDYFNWNTWAEEAVNQAVEAYMAAHGTDGDSCTVVANETDEGVELVITNTAADGAASSQKVLIQHGNDSSQNVELDTTLTQSGKAADAKAVGDALASKLDSIMVSPDGSRWRISIGDDGVLTSEKIIVEIPATGISLSASTLTFNSSANQTIKATLTPADSTDVVVWETSNPDVATVSNGVVAPIGNGSCTITATAGSVFANCAITVDVAVVETYSITRNITNATGFDDSAVIGAGSELLECYISNDECTMDGATATITMGGVDITETAWDNGVVNIAEVTGDVVITLDAVKIQYIEPPVEDFTVSVYGAHLHIAAYVGEDTAIAIPTSMTYEGNTYTVADNTLNLYYFNCGNVVEHVKIPDGMTQWGSGNTYTNAANFAKESRTALRTVSGCTQSSCKNSPNIEKVQDIDKVTGTELKEYYLGVTNIRTLENVAYPDTVTSLNLTYQNCTGLVDGGTIPAQITAMNGAFYCCTNLRRIRIETVNDITYTHNPFYGCSAYMEMELYSESGFWKKIERANASLKRTYKFIGGETHNRIIIIGDSLTGGTYGSYLRDLVPNNATVNESAQGGWTSQQIYEGKMLVDPVKMRLPESIVVIWHGTNGYGTDGSDGVTAKMVAALDGNQRYLLIPPTGQGEGDEVYESWKATYGEEHVLSMGDWFANNGYTVSDYLSDGTHFTADGYALVAQAVYEKIQQWL